MLPVHPNDCPTPAPLSPIPRKGIALPPGKAPAAHQQNDRASLAPIPLSDRQQQVLDYRSQDLSFKTIADRLGCSETAAIEYYRRALAKLQPAIANAVAPLEQGDRSTKANPEPALAEPPRDRLSSAPASICTRSPFHPPAVDASALLERPNQLDLCVSSLFVTGNRVANGEYVHGRSHSPQTTTTETPPRPRRRKRSSRRSRRVGVGFCVAIAS